MTDKEKIVYDSIVENDDGIGVPAKSYYMYYMGDKLTNGLTPELKEKEFIEIVKKLYSDGYLDKSVSFAGDDIFTIKKSSSSSAQGNLFQSVLDKFSAASKQEIMDTAVSVIYDFSEATGVTDPKSILQTAMMGATIGIGEVEEISANQKKLIDHVFSTIFNYNGDMEPLYNAIKKDCIHESTYTPFELAGNSGNPSVGMPLLFYILSFVYIEGTITEELSNRLENMFASVLLAQFFSQEGE